MLARTFHPRQFLRYVYATEPFVEYCERRGIPFDQLLGMQMRDDDFHRWRDVLARLSESEQAGVELELAQVNELADADAIAILTEACAERSLPPETLPGDPARALWFFLWHPATFRDVLLQREVGEIDAWRTAQGPADRSVTDLPNRQRDLAESLQAFFRMHDGTGRYCVVDAFTRNGATCFAAYLSDRLQLFDVFTDVGKRATRADRPAIPLLFVYEPASGVILLMTRLRSTRRILDLVRLFGKAVLGAELGGDCLRPAYRLDVLKRQFDLPADRSDMEAARVKSLHLAYPERSGRRRIKLETLAGDDRFAIRELLRTHVGDDATLDALDVQYAELEVRLRAACGRTAHVIRLWPDRTNLSQTPTGDRFRACLRRWGLTHAA
jgi:hypothetical protein